MVLYIICPAPIRRDEAILRGKPAEDPDVRCLELPDRMLLDLDATEIPPIVEAVSDDETIEDCVDLFDDGCLGPQLRGFRRPLTLLQPFDEIPGPVESTDRQLT